MICDIFLPIMPAIFAHSGEKYNLAQILRKSCALEKEVQSCANLAHILRIGEEVQSCAYVLTQIMNLTQVVNIHYLG